MTGTVIVIAACLIANLTLAQGRLEVTIRNIREKKGDIRVGLFDSESAFLKDAVAGKVVRANASEITVVFDGLRPGEYALSVIHDANTNGELDSNAIGIPTEGFAFGNNAMGMFGPPSFQKASLVIEDRKKISQVIEMKYL